MGPSGPSCVVPSGALWGPMRTGERNPADYLRPRRFFEPGGRGPTAVAFGGTGDRALAIALPHSSNPARRAARIQAATPSVIGIKRALRRVLDRGRSSAADVGRGAGLRRLAREGRAQHPRGERARPERGSRRRAGLISTADPEAQPPEIAWHAGRDSNPRPPGSKYRRGRR